MLNIINLLMVDDHPFVLEAYKNYLSLFEASNNYKFNIDTAHTVEETLTLVDKSSKKFDILFLDIRIPENSDGKMVSGEELGQVLKKKLPNLKIMVITGHYDELMISNILYNLKPDAIFYKSDVDAVSMNNALKNIIDHIPYYSNRILKVIHKKFSSDIVLDKMDKQLLYELSKGTKTKNLTNLIPLSIGGIEKRKRLLKQMFNPEQNNDSSLIESACKKGFL